MTAAPEEAEIETGEAPTSPTEATQPQTSQRKLNQHQGACVCVNQPGPGHGGGPDDVSELLLHAESDIEYKRNLLINDGKSLSVICSQQL